jgi:spoIIIJ-associated protein
VREGQERYEIELWGADQELLLRDDGRPLLSIQHLLARLVRGLTGESIYCRVDCDQFHEIREERLRDLAQRVAREVADQHRSRLLESMSPDERRIVHVTLTDDPHVDTESQGEGYFKRVKIFPV